MLPNPKQLLLLPLLFCFACCFAQQYTNIKGIAKVVFKNSYGTKELTVSLKYSDDACWFNDIDGKTVTLKLTDRHTEAMGFGRGYWDVYSSANTLAADYKQYTVKINKERGEDAFIIEDHKQGITYTVEKAY
jgi:hypothetical protein